MTETGLREVFDSGSDFEAITAVRLPEQFSCSNDNIDLEDRSGKKGPEPEGTAVGSVNGRTYGFIALERIGGVMVYDITDPAAADKGYVLKTIAAPDDACARSQLAVFLWRAAGKPAADGAMGFSDVRGGAYYTEAVRWAAGLGIVSGYGDGSFGVDDPVTREQLAVMLYRFAKARGMDTTQGGHGRPGVCRL